jgi:hypothetical protein
MTRARQLTEKELTPMPTPVNLIRNERTKLLAAALDRVSTLCVAAGIVPPLSGFIYGGRGLSLSTVAACYIWLLAAVALHLGAQRVLGRLQE